MGHWGLAAQRLYLCPTSYTIGVLTTKQLSEFSGSWIMFPLPFEMIQVCYLSKRIDLLSTWGGVLSSRKVILLRTKYIFVQSAELMVIWQKVSWDLSFSRTIRTTLTKLRTVYRHLRTIRVWILENKKAPRKMLNILVEGPNFPLNLDIASSVPYQETDINSMNLKFFRNFDKTEI